MGQDIEALERPKAKARQRDGGKAGGEASGNLPEASGGDTRDKVGADLGMSEPVVSSTWGISPRAQLPNFRS
jgi:hypothetical protein